MKIGIEARWVTYEKTGFGNYAVNLLRKLSCCDRDNNYIVYTNCAFNDETVFSNKNFVGKVLPGNPGLYKHIKLPFDLMRQKKIDLFHFLYNAPPFYVPCDYILTIHDLSYRHIPDMISRKDYLSINLQLPFTARKAKKIIAVSENTKKDIINYLGISEDKIEVIYEGVGENYYPQKDPDTFELVKRKYCLPDKFILYVGTYLPHKNIGTLLKAFRELLLQGRMNSKLVLAGKKGRNYRQIEELISELSLQDHVVSPGFVAEEDLPCLYSMSEMFIFPSLYEGFGLPILEAMACGVPVLSSSASCLKEIGGDAARYFSPTDYNDLARCIADIDGSDNLQREMKDKGIRRASCFNWELMAEKTRKIYEAIGSSKG